MRAARPLALALALALGLAPAACSRKSGPAQGPRSALYTGKEAKRKVHLSLPALGQGGLTVVGREIYATASQVAQAKQLLQALMAGPAKGEEAAPCFGPGAEYLEVYLDGKGLAVVDLPAATAKGLPGGSSAEAATLLCLLKTFGANLPAVSRIQVLIDGQPAESLSGHIDLQDPLALGDF